MTKSCLLETWTAAHVAGSVPDQIPRLLGEAPSLIGLAERIGDAQQQAAAYAIAAIHYVQFGNLPQAELLLERIDRLATEFNHPFLRWVHANHRCCHLTISGTGNQIEAAALEALQLGQSAGQPDVLTWFGPQLFAARWAQGRLAEMVGLIGQVASGSPGLPAWRAGLALSYLSAGDHQRAVSILDELMTDPDRLFAPNILWLLGHSVLAEVVAAVGTPEQAEGRVPAAPALCRSHSQPGDGGPTSSELVARHAGRPRRPQRSGPRLILPQALDEHERLGAHVFLARTRLEWGRFLLSQGETAPGRTLLGEAKESASALGAAGIVAASAGLLAGTVG